MFHGAITALVTPFKNNVIDVEALDAFINWQIAQSIDGLLICGSTGESFSLSADEQFTLIKSAVASTHGRVPVIAGASALCTEHTVELAKNAAAAGADAVLIVVPPYLKPSQTGLIQHYEAVADSCSVPVVLYNNPGRSTVGLDIETIAHLAQHKNIIGIKDADVDLSRIKALRNACGDDFLMLSGDDETSGDYLEKGGHGCVSVVSNIAPHLCASMQASWRDGDTDRFKAQEARIQQLSDIMFCETNPCPAKFAVSHLGFGGADLRLPLTSVTPETEKRILSTMDICGVSHGGS